MNPYRLKADGLFHRTSEDEKADPRRIVFLSVEGNVTECNYFNYVDKYKDCLGIESVVDVHVLNRSSQDNLSAPADVLELLEEYMEYRDKTLYELTKDIFDNFDEELVRKYLVDPSDVATETRETLEEALFKVGIDIQYKKFLDEYQSKNDIFGIVLDRDYKSHTKQQLASIIKQCKEKNYYFFISNPCFEFWLLMHLSDIKTEFVNDMDSILDNAKVSSKHTYVSKLVSDKAAHSKKIPEEIFKTKYLPNIDKAIKQAIIFSVDIQELAGIVDSNPPYKGQIGTNIHEIFKLLREKW